MARQFLFEILLLPGDGAASRKSLERRNLRIEGAQPRACVPGRVVMNIAEGGKDAGFRLGSDDYLVLLHFRESPCSFANSSRSDRSGRPSPRFA